MKIVALYKTFSGAEFAEASVESIYPFMDKIVMVHSDVSWTGQTGNTVRPAIESMPDPDDKIIHIDVSVRNQTEQYEAGISYIENNLKYDLVMLVDTDEVWDPWEIEKALKFIADHPSRSAYMCGMYIYIKTPFYRIVPAEGRPVIFVRDANLALEGARGVGVKDKCMMYDVRMHHFTAVRKSMDAIREKIMSSFVGDLIDGDIPEPDVEWWIKEKYDKLPGVTDFHYFAHVAHLWKSIEKIWIEGIPEALDGKPIMDDYLPPGLCTTEEEYALYTLLRGLPHAVELGTYRGRMSVVLSLAVDEVFTIDLYEKLLKEKGHEEAAEWSDGTTVKDVAKVLNRYSNIGFLQGYTHLFAGQTERTNALFIDAGHNYESVKKDFDHWWPEVVQGGYIIFHDADGKHHGVRQVIAEAEREHPLMVRLPKAEVGSLAIFVKC